MDKNTVLLRDTEAFMRGELDNVTVAQNSIVLDLVQGSYVPYGCYTSAPLPMPLFDALRVSWNAASPNGTAVEAQCRVLVDGNWTQWVGFGKWSPCLHREGVPYQERGPVQRWHDHLQLDSKCATMVQLRIYLYTRDEKASPLVTLLGASTHVVDVIPARGRPVNARMHMMPYAVAHRAPALRPWMDLAIALASLTNRWGADLLPEEFAQVLRDWRTPDDHDPRSLSFAAAAAARWGFPAWVAYGDLALLRAEARAGYGAVVRLQAAPAQTTAGMPETRYVAVRGFAAIDGNPQVLLPAVSDKLGRKPVLYAVYIGLAAGSAWFAFAEAWWLLAAYALLTFFYSGGAAVQPSFNTDLFGLAHAGVNYGFIALGMSGGSILSYIGAQALPLAARHWLAGACAAAGLVCVSLVKPVENS